MAGCASLGEESPVEVMLSNLAPGQGGGVGDAALFQNMNVQLTDERLGGCGCFDQDAVAWNDAGGVLHQHFGKLLDTGVGHGIDSFSRFGRKNYNTAPKVICHRFF